MAQFENIKKKEYLTINGQERYDQANSEDFIVDLKNFIDKKSNKIRFKLDAVLKLLPYNGFYPQQRTMQIAGIFNKAYLDHTEITNDSSRLSDCRSNSEATDALFKTLAATQPLFSPGILFNTIKAGIAMPWSCYFGNNGTIATNVVKRNTVGFITDHESYYVDPNYKLPFETILDPSRYYIYNLKEENEHSRIYYLDPTHLGFLENYENLNIASIPFINKSDIIIMRDSAKQNLYKSAINNFLFETANFFLKDGKLSNFKSKTFNEGESIHVEYDKEYIMDVVIRKHKNFSMFNDKYYQNYIEGISTPNITEGGSENKYIPVASLFGPPHQASSQDSEEAYYKFCPPYFRKDNNDEDRVTLKVILSSDGLSLAERVAGRYLELDEIIENIKNNLSYSSQIINILDCLKIDSIKVEDNKKTWYIQTKFEAPLINFNKCYYTLLQIKNYPIKVIEEEPITD